MKQVAESSQYRCYSATLSVSVFSHLPRIYQNIPRWRSWWAQKYSLSTACLPLGNFDFLFFHEADGPLILLEGKCVQMLPGDFMFWAKLHIAARMPIRNMKRRQCRSHLQSFCACLTSDHFSSCLRPPLQWGRDYQTNLVRFSNRGLRDWVQNSVLQTPVIVCHPSILSQTRALHSCVQPL